MHYSHQLGHFPPGPSCHVAVHRNLLIQKPLDTPKAIGFPWVSPFNTCELLKHVVLLRFGLPWQIKAWNWQLADVGGYRWYPKMALFTWQTQWRTDGFGGMFWNNFTSMKGQPCIYIHLPVSSTFTMHSFDMFWSIAASVETTPA